MKKNYENVILITGTSSGIGKECAKFFMNMGFKVYGTSRNAKFENTDSTMKKNSSGKGFIKMLPLDVCSCQSVQNVLDYILQKEGHIDILINNAGFGIAGSVEDTTVEEAKKQFDTNFFGVHRMCRMVIPVMRSQKNGLIINISSVAGLISIPYQSMYSASKYALEALTEAMRIELKPFGIKTVLVEPGDTRTGFTENRQKAKASDSMSAYNKTFSKSLDYMAKSELEGPGPEVIAKKIRKLATMKNPPVRIVVGMQYKFVVILKRLLPSRIVEYIVARLYG